MRARRESEPRDFIIRHVTLPLEPTAVRKTKNVLYQGRRIAAMSYEKVGDQFPLEALLPAAQQPPTHVQPPPFQQPSAHVQPPPFQQPKKLPLYVYPAGQTQPPLNQYYPAPPGPMYAPQQQQHSNVVAVTSQPAQPPNVLRHQVYAPDYMTLTVIGLVVCFFCGGVIGMVLLVPAFICSAMAQNANSSGDYEGARNLGRASLGWNIVTYIIGTLGIAGFVVFIVLQYSTSY